MIGCMAAGGADDIAVERRPPGAVLHLGVGGEAVALDGREAAHLAAVLRALAQDRLPPHPRWLGSGAPGELPPRDGRPGVVVALDPDDADRLLLEILDGDGWPACSRRLAAGDALDLADRLDGGAS